MSQVPQEQFVNAPACQSGHCSRRSMQTSFLPSRTNILVHVLFAKAWRQQFLSGQKPRR